MSTVPSPDPLSLKDAMMEASHLLDLAISAALEVPGSGEYRVPLEAIAREAKLLRSAAIPSASGEDDAH